MPVFIRNQRLCYLISMAGAAVPKYLAGSPKGFAHSCDILLKLDDGSEVPAHSQVLARYSKVFSDMLEEDGPLNRASGTSKVIVPINECSKDEAIQWLCVVYSFAPTSLIGEATGLSTARLAHKYGMKVWCWFTLGPNLWPPCKLLKSCS